MKNANSFGYFSKDVAADLEITTSSLRRWSIEQKQVLPQIRDMGNHTAHEIKTHEVRILKQALHVVEFVLYNIYVLPNITIITKP
ncbi:hypothetical protein P9858_22420 [Niallia circulans]|uniref:hypothetical protein n=1 Tax=Niallia circulans TaxID=1397 RepID=UPI002E2464AD|nr:hypothetical protein [Niallia circulans]